MSRFENEKKFGKENKNLKKKKKKKVFDKFIGSVHSFG